MNVSLLKYPKKSHRKSICIPRNSALLAEFLGIEFGDGGIGNSWQVIITLNAISDVKYSQYVVKLINKLFGVEVAVRKRKNENTLQLVSSSTSLVDFLVTKGAVRGNKVKQHFDVPDWVRKNMKYEKAFVRGLVDTDGCLYIHRHTIKGITYKNIGFCFTSGSQNLLNSVANILSKFKIKPHVIDNGKRIYLYSAKAITHYLAAFGSSNPRITNTYKIWRGAGVV